MVETYKKIEGFENYSVSDFGNVRNDKTGRILKSGCDTCGYLRVCLMKNKTKHFKSIHRLIAEAFLLNPENKKCIDHIDNNRQLEFIFRHPTHQWSCQPKRKSQEPLQRASSKSLFEPLHEKN